MASKPSSVLDSGKVTGGQLLLASAWPLDIITISDHRPETGVTPESAPTCQTVLQSCSLQCSPSCPAASSDINNKPVNVGKEEDLKNDAWKEIVRQKSKVYFFLAIIMRYFYWSVQKHLSFRLDNFDYDEISLGSEESSPHLEMALLSHTLQYLTGRRSLIIFSSNKSATLMPWIEDNLRDANTNRTEENVVSEFTSSCSLYPQILPIGRWKNWCVSIKMLSEYFYLFWRRLV